MSRADFGHDHFLPLLLHHSFFVRLRIPFLRPDPRAPHADARRSRQDRPSLRRRPLSTVARPHLYGTEHAGKLMVVGMKFEGSPLSGTRTLVPQPCIRWITPYHDACMRIGGEAPRWWTHS